MPTTNNEQTEAKKKMKNDKILAPKNRANSKSRSKSKSEKNGKISSSNGMTGEKKKLQLSPGRGTSMSLLNDPNLVSPSQGTVKGPNSDDFNVEEACQKMRKAFKGLGTDEKEIIHLMGTHTNRQRLDIKKKYKQMYGRDLLNDFEDELGGHFLELALALFCPAHLYDAHLLQKAIQGVGTDEATLTEIVCTRSNSELELIKEAYYSEFRANLEKTVSGEVSGDYGRLIKSLLNANRDENDQVNYRLAEKDAEKLIQAGIGKMLGTDVTLFNQIFCVRSWPQLKATFDYYKKKTENDMEMDLRKEFDGDEQNALITIVKVSRNMPGYFAEKLHEAMRGVGTDDAALIRIIVSRCEVDLALIKDEYQKRFKKSLAKSVKDDCSGDYYRLLAKLIGN